jgi:hypothetical protein
VSRWRRRGGHVRPQPGGRAARAGRVALIVATLASAGIALLALGVTGTLAQFTASIINTDNHVQSASVALSESMNTTTCSAPGDGQWHDCTTINKYGGGSLNPGGSTSQTVTLQNTGTAPASLSLLPSACTDSLTGAGGQLCNLISVTVACPTGTTVFTGTLNAFQSGRNYPTGYAVGTLAAGASISCTFTLTAASSIPAAGTVSQPISWKLA